MTDLDNKARRPNERKATTRPMEKAVARTILLATCGCLLAPALATPSAAQQSSAIVSANEIIVGPNQTAPLGLKINSTRQLPANTFLRITKLPDGATLSDGYRVSAGTWAIPLDRLSQIRLRLTSNIKGRHTIELLLTSLDGKTLDKKSITLSAQPQPKAPPKLVSNQQKQDNKTRRDDGSDVMQATANLEVGKNQATSAQPAGRPSPKPLTPEQRQRATRYMQRGRTYLSDGNIATARLFFRRAADLGLAAGAMALAETFDPAEIAVLGIVGSPADVKEARRWYLRAKELGSPDAEVSLQLLRPQ